MSKVHSLDLGPKPACLDLYVYRGNTTKPIILNFKRNEAPVDISTRDFVFRAVNAFGGVVFRKNVGDGLTIVDGPNGKLKIDSLTPADTRKFMNSSGEYEVEMRDGSRQETILKGRIIAAGGNNDDD